MALERSSAPTEPKAEARSALPEASAVGSALVRSTVRGPVTGEARTGGAGSEACGAPARDAEAECNAASAARSAREVRCRRDTVTKEERAAPPGSDTARDAVRTRPPA